MLKLIFALIAVAVAVPAGGLLAGVDRRLTARLQSRQGPPLLQPFYDVLKLFGKAPCVTNPWLIFSSYVCLMASAIALLMFFMQGDMLLLFFVIPVRVKYFGLFAAAMWLFSFLTAGWLYKVSYLLSMLGFALFFGPQALRSVRAWIRREQWKRKNRR